MPIKPLTSCALLLAAVLGCGSALAGTTTAVEAANGMVFGAEAPALAPLVAMAQAVKPDVAPAPVDAATDAVEANSLVELQKSLLAVAMGLRETRYVRGGIDPTRGFDCSGFVRYVFSHAIGVQLPRNSASQFLAGLKVNRAEMRPGDLVFFRTSGKRISHVGIYIAGDRFIHSPSAGKAVEISSLKEGYWAKRFAGAKRPEAIAQVDDNG